MASVIFPVVFPSAAYFWVNHDFINDNNSKLLPESRKLVDLPQNYELLNDKKVIWQIMNKYQIPSPVKVFSPKDGVRKESRWISCLAHPSRLPANAFVEAESILISDGHGRTVSCRILIASPELCFLQMAAKRSLLETIRFGYDLCSTYRQDSLETSGQVHRKPPVNTDMLRRFLDWTEGMYGSQPARKALKYIKDNSNSPMETRLAMIGILPFSYGGFYIDGQELNGDIIFSEQAAAIFRREKCSCDAVWRDRKIVMEYDSNKMHLSAEQHDWDKRKASALAADGYAVLSVTGDMTASIQDLEKTFVTLRSMLGKRTDMKRIEATRNARRKLIWFLKHESWWTKQNAVYRFEG